MEDEIKSKLGVPNIDIVLMDTSQRLYLPEVQFKVFDTPKQYERQSKYLGLQHHLKSGPTHVSCSEIG